MDIVRDRMQNQSNSEENFKDIQLKVFVYIKNKSKFEK